MTVGSKPFGGASPQLLAHVALNGAAAISVADAGTREAFLNAWVEHLSEHAMYVRAKGKALAAPVALVYVPDTGAHARDHEWKVMSMLGVSEREDMAGKLVAGSGETGGCTHPQRFTDLEKLEDAIRSAGLGNSPTVVLATELRLIVWGNGVEGGGQPSVNELRGGPITVDLKAVEHELDRFYEDVARQTKTWWKNASERVTIELPEAKVQYDLWVWLMCKFSSAARVRQEDTSGNGRTDLTIVPLDNAGGNQSAVLELKTIRDVHTPKTAGAKLTKISQKENTDWATSGLQQTATYRDDLKMNGAFLCLYDFCAGDGKAMMAVVDPIASQFNVRAKRFWITASHEEHRKDRYPVAVPQAPT